MDEVELAEAAVFSLGQAAGRLRALADQAHSPALQAQLRTLAEALDGHAREIQARRPAPV